jgi:hypothetical protein
MAVDLTIERIAHNQATFREANEDIELAAERMRLYGSQVPFICECPRAECSDIVRLTLEEYEEVRARPEWFATAPGHEDISVESGAAKVVDERPGYVVVEKVGSAGEIARERAGELPED